MKGIILAGGNGTRLYPITIPVTKQLLPVYDKPMIFYPLSTLMLADIRDVMIIVKPEDVPLFTRLLGDGSHLGMHIEIAVQEAPRGLAEAFIIGKDFIADQSVCLILGDNIFYGSGLTSLLRREREFTAGGVIFGREDNNPRQFGVIEIGDTGNVISIEEKPEHPKSNNVATGLYMFDNSCVQKALSLNPSARNELEITDIINQYLSEKLLKYVSLGRGFKWFDCGTAESLLQASQFIHSIQNSDNYLIACLEEIALSNKWITKEMLIQKSRQLHSSEYDNYIKLLVANG